MGIQLPLPAGWAQSQSLKDPRERLDSLRYDVLQAKAAIRQTLEWLAERHRIPMREVERSMNWADDGLADLVYETERDLANEIDNENSL